MVRTIFLIYIYLICKELPTTNQLSSSSILKKNQENLQEDCVGWCLHVIQDALENTNKSVYQTGKVRRNETQEKRFSKLRTVKNPDIMVQVGMNLITTKGKSQGPRIKLPSDLFYPYTTEEIQEEIDYNEHGLQAFGKRKSATDVSRRIDNNMVALFRNLRNLSNSYFRFVPRLHNNNLRKSRIKGLLRLL